ncbi:hypothetical protein VNO80_17864 [Phaseolus coccineus]|uniref:Uncharacterized protein n=1 Tax=Phaseolus coccineus TaxID=3886 RepID=A0AAN9QYC7_PHACN
MELCCLTTSNIIRKFIEFKVSYVQLYWSRAISEWLRSDMYMSILSKGQAQLGFVGLCRSQNGEKVCLPALRFLAEYASKFQDNYISIDDKSNTRRNSLSISMTVNTISPSKDRKQRDRLPTVVRVVGSSHSDLVDLQYRRLRWWREVRKFDLVVGVDLVTSTQEGRERTDYNRCQGMLLRAR